MEQIISDSGKGYEANKLGNEIVMGEVALFWN